MKTLDRYVIREVLPPLLLSLLIFTFILEIPPVMEQLESLVSKGVSWTVAGRILITLIPQALGLTIPMALLVGLLIGLGRLSGDREAVALLACGVSPYRLLRPVMALTGVAVAVHLYVMIRGIPDANQSFREITYEVVSKRVENDVRPQVFFDDFPGWVLYARDVPPSGGGWRDVLVADTRGNNGTVLYLARNGRLVLDRVKQTVDLILINGTRYSNTGPDGRQIETYRFPRELIVSLDPKTVFPRMEIQRGINELPITDLIRQADDKRRAGLSPHAEVMAIQQKFSFPMANVVFAIIGLALGLSVAREGKVAGFVIGIVVIFGYYILLYLCEGLTKGHFLEMHLSRWMPNLLLLPFGIVALIWRARWAEGRKPFGWLDRTSTRLKAWWAARQTTTQEGGTGTPAATSTARAAAPRSRKGVLIVVRVPRLTWLSPNILDRYISRIYLKTAAISFAALLGIFYIATFIDRSDKLFKGQATTGMLMQLLALMTPQFIYYVIPIAALLGVLVTFGVLSRTSELSVIKACGVSIYRLAAPLLVLSLVWSGTLFSLEQRIMALANRKADALDSTIRGRPPRTFNALSRRWLVGHDGGIYHYSYFDPQKQTLDQLAIYQPSKNVWSLESQTFVKRAVWTKGTWTGVDGWRQGFEKPGWDAFDKRPLTLETPDYFETEQPVAELMTVPQLKTHIDELSASGFNIVPLTVDLQKKLAFPFVTFVMTLLAIPFGLTTGKRGTLYGIGIGIVLALSYWTLSSAFAAIGKAGLLDPILAGWAPNVITAGSALYLLLTTRT